MSSCCDGFVSEEMQKKLDENVEDADKEYRDLSQVKVNIDIFALIDLPLKHPV